jgi:hypothetical protein
VREQPVVLGGPPKQRDAAHAILSGYIQRRFEALGFLVAREVRIDSGRYHGWIDLLAFDPATLTLYLIEVKTIIDDLGGIERTMDWYAREVFSVAARSGWSPLRVVPWLLVLATDDVEGQLRANRAAIDAAFPMRAAAMSALLATPSDGAASLSAAPDAGASLAAPPEGTSSAVGRRTVLRRGVALVDPRSRRRAWLIRSRMDGRRSPAPYRNYADFVSRR